VLSVAAAGLPTVVRKLAKAQSKRLLAIANALDGMCREAAARQWMTRTLCFNTKALSEPNGLVTVLRLALKDMTKKAEAICR
jgi:hypothetical protein